MLLGCDHTLRQFGIDEGSRSIGANVSSVPTRDSEDSRPYDRSSEVSASRFTIRHCDGRMRSHDSCKGEGASGGATGVEDEAGSGESMLVDSA